MSNREQLLERLRAAVRPDEGRIPTFIFTNPEVYALELERIFQRAWLFVAHESELPSRGDYVTRSMGEQPVIVARGEDDQVRVFLNVCRHRGMRIARTDCGNTSHFRCPYHGFTYAYTGQLTGVPFQRDAYGDSLDKSRLSLIQARTDSYKGLVFATWDQHAQPLRQDLGDITWYLDILIGRAEMEVVGPPQKWAAPAAWKLPAENFMSDSYHTAHTHASIPKLDLVPGGMDFGKSGYQIYTGGGHGLGLGTQEDGPTFPQELLPEFGRNLSSEQLALLNRLKNLHGNVFPNFSFLIPSAIRLQDRLVWGTTLRVWQPRGPDRIEVASWYLVEKHAPEWWKTLSRQSYILTFGISGMLEQDDTENWEHQTANYHSLLHRDEDLFLNYEMGLGREPLQGFSGPGEVYEGKFNEHNARHYYREWLRWVLAESTVERRESRVQSALDPRLSTVD